MTHRSRLRWFRLVLLAVCAMFPGMIGRAQTTLLGKGTNDTFLPAFWLQATNADRVITGLNSSGSLLLSTSLIPWESNPYVTNSFFVERAAGIATNLTLFAPVIGIGDGSSGTSALISWSDQLGTVQYALPSYAASGFLYQEGVTSTNAEMRWIETVSVALGGTGATTTNAALRSLGAPQQVASYATLAALNPDTGAQVVTVAFTGAPDLTYRAESSDPGFGAPLVVAAAGGTKWWVARPEKLDVRWFGAVANDSTDDTAAVQAAMNAGDYILFKDGTYDMLSLSRTNLALNPFSIEIAPSATVKALGHDAATNNTYIMQVSNVKIFGGGTIDCNRTGRGYVYYQKSGINFIGGLNSVTDIHLKSACGYGLYARDAVERLSVTRCRFTDGADMEGDSQRYACYVGAVCLGSLIVEDCSFKGNVPSNVGFGVSGVNYINNGALDTVDAGTLIVKNSIFDTTGGFNGTNGMYSVRAYAGAKRMIVENCMFTNLTVNPAINATALYTTIKDNVIHVANNTSNYVAGMRIGNRVVDNYEWTTNLTYAKISGNTIIFPAQSTKEAKGIWVQHQAVTNVVTMPKVVISDNYLYGPGAAAAQLQIGIYCDGPQNTHVTDNRVVNFPFGYKKENTGGSTAWFDNIRGNYIAAVGQAIYLVDAYAGSYALIEGNVVSSTTAYYPIQSPDADLKVDMVNNRITGLSTVGGFYVGGEWSSSGNVFTGSDAARTVGIGTNPLSYSSGFAMTTTTPPSVTGKSGIVQVHALSDPPGLVTLKATAGPEKYTSVLVTSAVWTYGYDTGGWTNTPPNGSLIKTASTGTLTTTNRVGAVAPTAARYYTVSFNVEAVSGTFTWTYGGTAGSSFSTTGVKTQIILAANTDNWTFTGDAAETITLNLFSVKEVAFPGTRLASTSYSSVMDTKLVSDDLSMGVTGEWSIYSATDADAVKQLFVKNGNDVVTQITRSVSGLQSIASSGVLALKGTTLSVVGNGGAATNVTIDEGAAQSGQIITILGTNDTNTVQIVDSAGVVELPGGTAIILGANDTLTLLYTGSAWVYVSAGNN